jgi:glutamate-1-semialdehyde-2,1-aminomutase
MSGAMISNDAYPPAEVLPLERSQELKRRAEQLIPSVAQTFSKGPSQFPQGAAPVFLERGLGAHVWDVDGNEYIDYVMALGSVILGHRHEPVDRRVREQLARGVSFSMPHPVELELAELLVEVVPCAEMVRFAKNGSDATSGAVRLARAITGRDVVVCCGYHGWQDWFVGTTTRNRGVPAAVAQLTKTFTFNDLSSLENVLAENRDRVAAVILEPTGVVAPEPGFLEGVVELTRREGALLVFDEVVTGFRIALGGAQERFGVLPDIACVGKAMGNGYAIAAVVGRADLMQAFDEIFFSFTFAGDPAAIAAGIATIEELRSTDALERMDLLGTRLMKGFNQIAGDLGISDVTSCAGYGVRNVIAFSDRAGGDPLILKSLFQQEVIRRGILSGGYHNMSAAHDDSDVDATLRVYGQALGVLAEAVASGTPTDYLTSEPVKAVFRAL